MTESLEISVEFLSSTDLMTVNFLSTAGGKRFAVISTEIAVPVEGLASAMELISAKRVTLKATPSP